jgi:hypothetical protein
MFLSLSTGLILANIHASTPPITIEDLRQQIAGVRSAITSVDVTWTVKRDPHEPRRVVESKNRLLADDTGRSIMWTLSSVTTNLDNELRFTKSIAVHAFDGDVTVSFAEDHPHARIQRGRSIHAQTTTSELCQLNLFAPAVEPISPGLIVPDLLQLVNAEHASLRPEPEVVDGRACVVVDVALKEGWEPVTTLWIDVERGCVPLKRVIKEQGTNATTSYHADDVVQAKPGVWWVLSGSKVQSGYTMDAEIGSINATWMIAVEKDDAGVPALIMNAEVTPRDFQPKVPTGYLVMDQDENLYTAP